MDILDLKAELTGSLLNFIQTFYKIRTGRDFDVETPPGRESHLYIICRALIKVVKGEIKRLIINVPPRYGKTELLINFVAWAMIRFSDSNFLYVSYSHTLAAKQTKTIRDIMTMSQYKKMFHVKLSKESFAKDNFETSRGGSVYASGSGGTITGRGAGIFGCDKFGGAIIIDDIHKPDEAMSDTIREGVIDWYYNTMQSRLNNGKDTPIIFIGQRLHERDLPGVLLEDESWERIIIPALDEAGNALLPSLHSKEDLLKLKNESPYVFASQYQQNPQPSGGGVFKPEWFLVKDSMPDILETFITCDTAETSKTYNDPSVFSFWGVYKIKVGEIESDLYGIHWIDCREIWVEPKDLQSEFMNFYAVAMRFRKKPKFVAIEKKSTGATLLSILSEIQGINVIDVERTSASHSKADRFLEIQPLIARKQVSLPAYFDHTNKCIEHCRKITLNNTHRYDDICDTLYDAVKFALIDKVIITTLKNVDVRSSQDEVSKKIVASQRRLSRLKEGRNKAW